MNVARRSETDRWLFLVTLALCLIGAVMVFSASAVTAREQYGQRLLSSRAPGGVAGVRIAGMFALMKLDYRRLREPRGCFHGVCASWC